MPSPTLAPWQTQIHVVKQSYYDCNNRHCNHKLTSCLPLILYSVRLRWSSDRWEQGRPEQRSTRDIYTFNIIVFHIRSSEVSHYMSMQIKLRKCQRPENSRRSGIFGHWLQRKQSQRRLESHNLPIRPCPSSSIPAHNEVLSRTSAEMTAHRSLSLTASLRSRTMHFLAINLQSTKLDLSSQRNGY